MNSMVRISDIWKAKIEAWHEQEAELEKFERPRSDKETRDRKLLVPINSQLVTYTICIEGTNLKLEQLVSGTNLPINKTGCIDL
jgi:hypothetical protein